jgi:hypothetical protein
MSSTPTTAGSRRNRASEEISAENAILEVATPMSAYGDYMSELTEHSNGLDAPFELRIDAASPLSDRSAIAHRPNHDTPRKMASLRWETEDDLYTRSIAADLFQGSPYLTQTEYGSDTEYAWGTQRNLVHKSSSESSKCSLFRHDPSRH